MLLSFIGEHWWELLVTLAGFPPWRTVQAWRASWVKERGMDKDTLEKDDNESIRKVVRGAMDLARSLGVEGFEDMTLSCDAIAAKA
jgi:hypothetical protein